MSLHIQIAAQQELLCRCLSRGSHVRPTDRPQGPHRSQRPLSLAEKRLVSNCRLTVRCNGGNITSMQLLLTCFDVLCSCDSAAREPSEVHYRVVAGAFQEGGSASRSTTERSSNGSVVSIMYTLSMVSLLELSDSIRLEAADKPLVAHGCSAA